MNLSTPHSTVVIKPAGLSGSVVAPASKSIFQRVVAAALLAEGTTIIEGDPLCNDSLAALTIASSLGAKTLHAGHRIAVRGGLKVLHDVILCGESGLSLRMFTPIAALCNHPITLKAAGTLTSRPLGNIEEPLRALGSLCCTEKGYAPVHVLGPLKGGEATVDGTLSSQFLTGLLMALPCAPKSSRIRVEGLVSRPYIAMTLSVMHDFGVTAYWQDDDTFVIPGKQRYQARRYKIEGDWSGAAALLAAGAVTGPVTVHGLSLTSAQGDKAVAAIIGTAGAHISCNADSITVAPGTLRPFEADLTDTPDLFPPLAALALSCPGTSRLKGVFRLAHKETNRAHALVEELSKFGSNLSIDGDYLTISGATQQPHDFPVVINPHGDHRMAMAAAIAGLKFGPVHICNASCIDKSYPGFYEALSKLRTALH